MTQIDSSFLMNHTCLRIKDPQVSLPFYEKNFGMKVIREYPFPSMKFTIYMLSFEVKEDVGKNWSAKPGILELCHNWGSESADSFVINNGNEAPHRGFGHICFSVDNIEQCQTKLLEDGVKFQKRLQDGRQRNIAFALDPNGYWIELIENQINKVAGVSDTTNYRFNHTMIRVKDAEKSLDFYRNVLGFKVLRSLKFDEAKFTLYFLGYEHDPLFEEGSLTDVSPRQGIIELTHNWGTESDTSFAGYHNGNSTENGAAQGYGHTCVSCLNPSKFCQEIEQEYGDKVDWSLKWNKGNIKNIAFIRDPDGYSIEILGHDLFKDGNQEYQ